MWKQGFLLLLLLFWFTWVIWNCLRPTGSRVAVKKVIVLHFQSGGSWASSSYVGSLPVLQFYSSAEVAWQVASNPYNEQVPFVEPTPCIIYCKCNRTSFCFHSKSKCSIICKTCRAKCHHNSSPLPFHNPSQSPGFLGTGRWCGGNNVVPTIFTLGYIEMQNWPGTSVAVKDSIWGSYHFLIMP